MLRCHFTEVLLYGGWVDGGDFLVFSFVLNEAILLPQQQQEQQQQQQQTQLDSFTERNMGKKSTNERSASPPFRLSVFGTFF